MSKYSSYRVHQKVPLSKHMIAPRVVKVS